MSSRTKHHRLEAQLALHPPFDSLSGRDLATVAAAARIQRYAAGDLILDAFVEHSTDVYVVLSGAVHLWHDPTRLAEPPDDRLGAGGVFGYSAMLVERSIGPRVVAAVVTEVACIPGDAATVAFVSKHGARFLAGTMLSLARSKAITPAAPGATVQDLLRSAPLVIDAASTADDAARAIGTDGRGFAAVRLPDGHYRLVTDASLRQRILVDGLPATSPVVDVLDETPPTATVGDSTTELLLAMLDRRAQFVIVGDAAGGLRGVVSLRDFTLTPLSVDVSLHERLRYAPDLTTLGERSRRVPDLLGRLLDGGLSASKVIAVNSTIVDAIVRRAIELVFAEHPDLPTDAFTWLSLGSNGRREAVLSSDVDCAATFVDGTSQDTIAKYRTVFAEVTAALDDAGLVSDGHGTTAASSVFSRTTADWRAAAQEWIAAPELNQGAIMTSLLVDGRAIYGDRGLSAATALVGDLRSHPGTLRLLLEEALAHRARPRPIRTLLRRRPSRFDIKKHAILPLVNIARWGALNVGSSELGTSERLRAAAGTPMLPEANAQNLIDVFETLQRLRLHYQLMQYSNDKRCTDSLAMTLMSPIDRSVIGEAVREIAAAQRRMANISVYVEGDEWTASDVS